MTPAQVEWARCRDWIVAAVATNDFYTIEYIEAGIEEGRMEFIPGKHGAVVIEYLTYPNGTAMNVFAGGGQRGKALKEFVGVFHPRLCLLAEGTGCRWITVTGRMGWQHVGKSLGYKPAWNVIAKDLKK